MSKKEMSMLKYYIICIAEFALQKKISKQEAYIYLKNYKGLDFIIRNYEAEHILSLDNAVEDMTLICQKNGGNIL